MNRLAVFLAALLATALVACGGGGSSTTTTTNPATGAWTETLATTSGQQVGSFTFDMTQNNTNLMGSNVNFTNMSSLAQCFGAGTVMNGSMMGSGMMNGGTMTMTISWTPSGSTQTNTMTMQGNMAMGMGSGSGTFTVTGQTPGCTSQTGNFTMSHMSNSMM
jgi:hypothetical protein